jgi:hypothetical protein
MSLFPKLLPVIFFAFTRTSLYAQEEHDAALWTTLNIQKKLTQSWVIQFTEEFRLRDNFRQLNLFYSDFCLEYRKLDWFRFGVSYRWINKYQAEGWFSYRHRLTLDAIFRSKWRRFGFSYRNRLQTEVQDLNNSADGRIPEWYSRHRVELKYNTKGRFQPFVAYEARFQVKDPRRRESDGLWHRNRFSAGVQYEIDKRNSVSLYYLIQREFSVSSPQQLYVAGLEYNFNW